MDTLGDVKSQIAPTEIPAPTHTFTQLYSATPRGARLARLMAVQQLADWGWAYDHGVSATAAQLVAELSANAVTHGRVSGRGFQLRLLVGPGLLAPRTLRVEVADAMGERRPDPAAASVLPPDDRESGRGLPLVAALAARWGVDDRSTGGKTIWSEVDLTTSHQVEVSTSWSTRPGGDRRP